MQSNQVAISSSSQISADAGRDIADAGRDIADAAIAASLTQLVTEPGAVSLAAGAFILIWKDGENPVTVDGASEMPGRKAPAVSFGRNLREVVLPFGGGTPTAVGYSSVATPGALAGYDLAARHYGRIPWSDLVEPARRHVSQGFPLPVASHRYIENTYEGVFGWNPDAMRSLLDKNGELKRPGEDSPRVACEPGLPINQLDIPKRCFDGLDMFFGGVSAAYLSPAGRFDLAADPRRTGGTALSGKDG